MGEKGSDQVGEPLSEQVYRSIEAFIEERYVEESAEIMASCDYDVKMMHSVVMREAMAVYHKSWKDEIDRDYADRVTE